jgi:hypothetical protein
MDATLTILVGIFIAATTVLGFEVAARPPQTKKRAWSFRGAFILLGIGMIVVTAIQTSRNSRVQSEMQARLDSIDQMVKAYANSSSNDPRARSLAYEVNKLVAPNAPYNVRAVAH